MEAAQPGQLAAPGRREPQADDPVVVGVALPAHEAGLRGPVDEPHCAVVAQEQGVGDVADGGSPAVGVPPHREEQLVLRRGDPDRLAEQSARETTERAEREARQISEANEQAELTAQRKIARDARYAARKSRKAG